MYVNFQFVYSNYRRVCVIDHLFTFSSGFIFPIAVHPPHHWHDSEAPVRLDRRQVSQAKVLLHLLSTRRYRCVSDNPTHTSDTLAR